jgi:hypothetical protein
VAAAAVVAAAVAAVAAAAEVVSAAAAVASVAVDSAAAAEAAALLFVVVADTAADMVVASATASASMAPAATGIRTAAGFARIIDRPARSGQNNIRRAGLRARLICLVSKAPQRSSFWKLVGAAGFEPTTCSTQNCRATRLRYTPIS